MTMLFKFLYRRDTNSEILLFEKEKILFFGFCTMVQISIKIHEKNSKKDFFGNLCLGTKSHFLGPKNYPKIVWLQFGW